MSLISSASQVTKAVKNVGRVREIVSAMSRFGFGTIVTRLGLSKFRTSSKNTGDEDLNTLPVRLRMLFEQLGPAFIKIGQVLAGRPDLIPPELVREFEKLQDRVPPLPFLALKPTLESELERTLDQCFSSFDTEALASASIAQVHAARTLDGDDVIVKIQKPEVEKILRQDLEILEMIAALAERYIPELRPFRPTVILDEFKRALLTELNFTREAQNVKKFRENFASDSFLVVPKVYSDLSSMRVITQERLRGVKLSDFDGVRAMGVDLKDILRRGMDAFFKTIMVDGFFHADPHAGNIFVLPDGRMGLIDFGSVGHLSDRSKDSIINLFIALLSEDYEALVREYVYLSPATPGSRSSSKLEAVQAEVATIISPYFGLPLKEIPSGKVLMEITGIAFKHHVTLPRDLVMVFKSIMTLEAIGRQLDPDFDLLEAASKYSKIILKDRYSPKRLAREAMFLGRDFYRFARTGPRQIGEVFRQIENGELKINLEIAQVKELKKAQLQAASKTSYAILTSVFLACSVFLFTTDTINLTLKLSLISVSLTLFTLGILRNFR